MAQYSPPNPYVPKTFNPANFITSSATITEKYLSENYLKFPFAQDTENFVSINNQGALNQGGRAEFSSATFPAIFTQPPTVTNPVVYPAVNPSTAVATIEYVNEAVMGGGGGGGDVYTNLPNQFTNTNVFSKTGISQINIEIKNTTNTATLGFITDSAASLKGPVAQTGDTQLFFNNGSPDTGAFTIQGNSTAPTGIGLRMDNTNLTATTYGIWKALLQQSPYNPLTTYGSNYATQNFVQSAVDLYAPLASPQITGVPTVPTAISGTNSTQIASTEFVQTAIASTGGGDVYAAGSNYFTGLNNFDWNSGGTTKNSGGLTLARNNIIGSNEVDLIGINSNSNVGMCLYAEPTQVTAATDPKIIIYNDGTNTLFNTQIDTDTQAADVIPWFSNQLASAYFVQTLLTYRQHPFNQLGNPYVINSAPNFEYSQSKTGPTTTQINSISYNLSFTMTTTANTVIFFFTNPISANNLWFIRQNNPTLFNYASNTFATNVVIDLSSNAITVDSPYAALVGGQTYLFQIGFFGRVVNF